MTFNIYRERNGSFVLTRNGHIIGRFDSWAEANAYASKD